MRSRIAHRRDGEMKGEGRADGPPLFCGLCPHHLRQELVLEHVAVGSMPQVVAKACKDAEKCIGTPWKVSPEGDSGQNTCNLNTLDIAIHISPREFLDPFLTAHLSH